MKTRRTTVVVVVSSIVYFTEKMKLYCVSDSNQIIYIFEGFLLGGRVIVLF
jgi:hypothetical protein